MAQSFDLVVTNDNEGLAQAGMAVASFLEPQSLTPKTEYAMTLSLEEMLTNVIKYAYDDDQQHNINISVHVGDTEAVMQLTDNGHEFNPLAEPEPDLDQSIEDRPIGGLGLHLVRSMTQRVEYERRDSQNTLTMYFSIRE